MRNLTAAIGLAVCMSACSFVQHIDTPYEAVYSANRSVESVAREVRGACNAGIISRSKCGSLTGELIQAKNSLVLASGLVVSCGECFRSDYSKAITLLEGVETYLRSKEHE